MTNENKHTPGLWIISENNSKEKVILQEFRTTPSGRGVQDKICTIENQLDWQKRDSNAALIAAAPELLEVLEQTFEDLKNGSYDENNVEPIINVINKARGEA